MISTYMTTEVHTLIQINGLLIQTYLCLCVMIGIRFHRGIELIESRNEGVVAHG